MSPSKSPDPVLSARGRLAYASHRGGNPAAITKARRELAAAKLERHVREVVAAEPKLTVEQLDRIAALLRPAFRSGGASA